MSRDDTFVFALDLTPWGEATRQIKQQACLSKGARMYAKQIPDYHTVRAAGGTPTTELYDAERSDLP